MTLLYYLKPIFGIHAGGDIQPPRKKKRSTYEIVKTEERPRDLRAIQSLAEGLIADQAEAALLRLKAEQAEAARNAREIRRLAKERADRKALELQEQMRAEVLAAERTRILEEIKAAHKAEMKRQRDERDAREAREVAELHDLLILTERMKGLGYEH